jgi:amino acid transporter
VVVATVSRSADEEHLAALGYRQRLNRTMGGFSSFAVSFSFISVTTGLFANYAFGLNQAGPRFIWTWVIVSVGQFLVALCFAHMAPRVPIAGYSYQWASKLVSHKFGWFPAWFAIGGWLTGTAGVGYAFAQYFAPYVGIGGSQLTIVLTTIIVLISWLGIQLLGVRLASRVNNFSVGTEIIGSAVVGLFLLILTLVRHPDNVHILTSRAGAAPGSYIAAFAVSGLVGAYTITGFDGAADLAEETKNPGRNIPRAIISTEVVSAVIGMIMLVGFTLAITNLHKTQASGTPLLYIMQQHLGSFTPVVMTIVFISIYACGLINLAAISRLVFSLSRDGVLPGSRAMVRLNGNKSPVTSLTVCTVIACLFVLVAKAESIITSVGSLSDFTMYFLVIVAGLAATKKLAAPDGSFSLGRWFRPIAYVSLAWLVIAVVALSVPSVNHLAAKSFLVVIVLAFVWYGLHIRRMPKPTSEITETDNAPGAGTVTETEAVQET